MHMVLCCALALLFLAGCTSPRTAAEWAESRSEAVQGCFGTYANMPRLADKHADIPRLLAELKDVRANTYHWLIRNQHEWEDLKLFLPVARRENIRVWVSLIPPSEPPLSQPFALDFIRWAKEIAQLSLQEPNLVAWASTIFSITWNCSRRNMSRP